MAFTQKQEQKQPVSFDRYYGVRNVKVIALNPTVEQLKDFQGGDPKPIEYKNEDGTTNIVFLLKSLDGDGTIYRKYFTISPEIVTSSTEKTQVIDKYGRDVWVTKEELANHQKPEWARQYANTATIGIDAEYKPAHHGEVNLIHFIKAYLGIRDRIFDITSNTMVDNTDMESRVCAFDNFEALTNGDISELQAIFEDSLNPQDPEAQPQSIKIMLGVHIADGKISNVIYPSIFLPWHARPSKKDNTYYEFAQAIKQDAQYAAAHNKPIETHYLASRAQVYASPNTQNISETGNTMPEDSIDTEEGDDLPF